MLIFYILLILLVILSLRYRKEYNNGYLSFDTTNAVKGIFILLVFIAHIVPYILKSGADVMGGGFGLVHNRIGQWIVAMFLFYSGYGIMESIMKKGNSYVANIPIKRVLNTLLNFDIAVLTFIIVALLVRTPLTIKQCLLSFTGWETVGNSNWYIFVILVCYALTFVSFYKQNNLLKSAFICFGLIVFTSLLLSVFKQEYWYNTMWCYSAGMVFSHFKDRIEIFAKAYYFQLLFAVISFLILVSLIPYHAKGLIYNSFSVLFCAMVVLLTMKFNIESKFLVWCGKNLFPIYIYQRIPMIILASVSNGEFIANYPVVYTGCCLMVTMLIAYLYKYWAVRL